MASWDYILKFVIVGEASTGKSSLLHQLQEGSFNARSEPTTGVEFGSSVRAVNMNETEGQEADMKHVKVQAWDVAGTPSFRSITRSYYRGSAGALLVYDVTSRQSFVELTSWLKDLRQHADENVCCILCANKHDLVEEEDKLSADGVPLPEGKKARREVSRAEGEEFAKREGLDFVECSAKSGLNVNEAFDRTAREILLKIQRGLFASSKPGGIKLSSKPSRSSSLPASSPSSSKGGCC